MLLNTKLTHHSIYVLILRYDFFSEKHQVDSARITSSSANDAHTKMSIVMEINEYKSSLNLDRSQNALTAFKDFGLFEQECHTIRTLIPELNNEDLTLQRAREILEQLRQLFGPSFKPYHLTIFEQLGGVGREVISFLLEQQKDFQAVVTRLTGELQTYDEGLKLLNAVINVRQN